MCNGLGAISSGGVSTGTGFRSVAKSDLHSAGGKTHKQALLGLLHAGKGSIWWGHFRGLGWKNGWPEDVLCGHARQFQCIISTTSCDLMPYRFSLIFTHKNWSDIWNKLTIECNVFIFVLSCLKGVDILNWKEMNRCALNADDVLVLGLDLRFNVFS